MVAAALAGVVVLGVTVNHFVPTTSIGPGPETTMSPMPSSEATTSTGSGVTKISDIFWETKQAS